MSFTREDIDQAHAELAAQDSQEPEASEQQAYDAEAHAEEDAEAQSIEQMAASAEENGEDVFEEDASGQQVIDFGDTLNLTVRGSRPTDSEIKIASISRPVKGQLGDVSDDEVFTVLVTVRQDELRFVTKRDGDGRTIGRTRRHLLTPLGVYLVSPEQADRLLGVE